MLYDSGTLQLATENTLSPTSHRSVWLKLMAGFHWDISHEKVAGRRVRNGCRPDIVSDY
jgi:hypothetical protein